MALYGKRHNKLRAAKKEKTSGGTGSETRFHTPLPTGPIQSIGCRDFLVGYSRKASVLVRLFYPAAVEASKAANPLLWPNWLPHENYKQGFADVAGVRTAWMKRLIERVNGKKNVFVPVIPNAKPLPLKEATKAKYPVIIFSHGLGACRTTYSTLCTELASHGFVVAAVEHRDNSACLSFFARRARYDFRESNPNFFPDDQFDGQAEKKVVAEEGGGEGIDTVDAEDEVDFGDEIDDPNYIPPKALSPISGFMHLEMAWVRHRLVPIDNHKPAVYQFRNRQIHHRVRECSRALDLIEALNAGFELENLLDPAFNKAEFEELLDLQRVTIMGHSMGGATALMSAAAELRFKVCVALDAWTFPIKDEPLDLIPQPVLLVNTETMAVDEPNTRKLSEIMSVIEGDDPARRQAWTINGSKHFQQCDIPFVMGWLALLLSGKSLGRVGISTFSVHDLTAALSMVFISKFLDLPSNATLEEYLEKNLKRRRLTYG